MSEPIRPRRSVLYMPASRASALEKARSLAADGLIFDLEDAVSPDAKETARAQAVAACQSGAYGPRELIIRVNGLNTAWGHDDLVAAASSGAHGVLLPKVEDGAYIRQADDILRAHGAPEGLAIWAMVETPLALLRVEDTARARRLAVLVMGTSDLAKDLHARPMALRLPFVTSLGLALLAARAYGRVILDGVHLDLADEAGFEAECRQGLDMGFDGKTLIHPKQIEPCNRIFAPSPEEVLWAERVMAAHQAALAEGKGVVLLDGRLIENLHVEAARRVKALAAAIAALGS
jgi:citrate lyase subunit beta / citryl-CoA lyase